MIFRRKVFENRASGLVFLVEEGAALQVDDSACHLLDGTALCSCWNSELSGLMSKVVRHECVSAFGKQIQEFFRFCHKSRDDHLWSIHGFLRLFLQCVHQSLEFFCICFLVLEICRLDDHVSGLRVQGLRVVVNKFHKISHRQAILFVYVKCLLDVFVLDLAAYHIFKVLLEALELSYEECLASCALSVLWIYEWNRLAVRHCNWPVCQNRLHGIAVGGNENPFQEVVFSLHPKLHVCSHNGAAEALDELVHVYKGGLSAPHSYRKQACRINDFLRCINREYAKGFFAGFFHGFCDGFFRESCFFNKGLRHLLDLVIHPIYLLSGLFFLPSFLREPVLLFRTEPRRMRLGQPCRRRT